MKKIISGLQVFLVLILILSTNSISVTAAQTIPEESTIMVIDEQPGSVTLELRSAELVRQQHAAGGKPCDLFTAQGLFLQEREGQPTIPTRGTLVNVPSLSGLMLEVLETPAQALPETNLCIGEKTETEPAPCAEPDRTVQQSNSLLGKAAQIGFSGIQRGQPVAQVQFYPLQVNADGQAHFYPRIRVRLTYHLETDLTRNADPKEAVVPLIEGDNVSHQSEAASRLPALKVIVAEDGIYQISGDDLDKAGWDLAQIKADGLHLTNMGKEIAIRVQGQEDGSFGPNDTLLFYGQAVTGPFTRQNVYWLTADEVTGLRMPQREDAPTQGYSVSTRFPAVLHAEEALKQSVYWANPPGREAQDHWYWSKALTAPTSISLSFQMPDFDTSSGSAVLRVQMAGLTDDMLDPDHHTRLFLMGLW